MNKENKYRSKQMFPLGGDIAGTLPGGAMNRKDFLMSVARFGILAMMLGLVAFFLFKRETTGQHACNSDFACSRCNKQGKCEIEKNIKPQTLKQNSEI
jgi:hypothetical protein